MALVSGQALTYAIFELRKRALAQVGSASTVRVDLLENTLVKSVLVVQGIIRCSRLLAFVFLGTHAAEIILLCCLFGWNHRRLLSRITLFRRRRHMS